MDHIHCLSAGVCRGDSRDPLFASGQLSNRLAYGNQDPSQSFQSLKYYLGKQDLTKTLNVRRLPLRLKGLCKPRTQVLKSLHSDCQDRA